jgi:hypothetical protein
VNSIAPSTSAEELVSNDLANPACDAGTLNGVAAVRVDDDHAIEKVPTSSAGLLVALLAILFVAPAGLAAVQAFEDSCDLLRLAVTSSGASVHAASPASPASPPAPPASPAPPVVEVFDVSAELDKPPREPQTAAAVRPDLDASVGRLSFPPSADGHRIYVDGKVVGEPPAPIVVACGQHLVKVGSRGRDRTMLVPCGDSVMVSYP